MGNERKNNQRKIDKPQGITAITVCGYKSICKESTIDVLPLTILAGANSSGKSSIIQPLLLLKQTLDSSFDPGALKLNGPNVQFTSADQMLSRTARKKCVDEFEVGIEIDRAKSLKLKFKNERKKPFTIIQMAYSDYQEPGDSITLRPGMEHQEIISIIPKKLQESFRFGPDIEKDKLIWKIGRKYCFLVLVLAHGKFRRFEILGPADPFARDIVRIIHVPGLRGNPERNYPVTAIGPVFQGYFQSYVASIINQWKTKKSDQLEKLTDWLDKLGLTWKVDTQMINDTTIEILVGRLPKSKVGGGKDLVSIADVGFGVSQSLPVLVSLLEAQPGQLVYIEQPEIHLHPRAQVKMAEILVDAAKRGVKVVAETHSSLLLLSVQTLVAKGEIPHDLVKLHWFERDPDGITKITSAGLDKDGAFGDWPQDFGKVELEAEKRYLDLAEKRNLTL